MIRLKGCFRALFVTIITLAFSGAISYSAFAANSSILTDEEKMEYSLNDIMFYQKCPTNGGNNESSAMCGTNQNYAGEQVFTDENMKAIEANKPFYEKAASQYGFPWQILAVIHMREHGLQRDNPSNGQGAYQLYSYTDRGTNERAFKPVGPISDAEFQRQTDITAKLIKENYGAGLDLSTDDGVKKMFFSFNGTSDYYVERAIKMGFTAKQADNGEGSPYVMNRYDAKRDPNSPDVDSNWIGKYTLDGEYDSSVKDEQWGAFTAYKAITCNGIIDSGPNDSAGASSDGGNSGAPVASSTVNGSNAKKISDTAVKLAWPEDGPHTHQPSEALEAAWEELGTSGQKADCGYFVQTVVTYSGVDPEYNELTKGSRLFGEFEDYVQEHPEKWEVMDFSDGDTSKLQAGDILMGHSHGGQEYHAWVIVEIDGELQVAEASHTLQKYGRITGPVGDSMANYDQQILARARGGASCDSCEKGSMNINGAAVCLAWPLGTDKSKTLWLGGTGTDLFNEFWEKEEGVVKGDGVGDCWDKGAYCCGFSAAAVRYSGYDPDFESGCGIGDHLGGGANQYRYAKEHPDLWELIPWDGSKEKVQGGDVVYYSGVGTGHSYVIVQDEKGELYIAEASRCEWYGRIDDYSAPPVGTSAFIIRAKNAKNSNAGVSVTDGVKPSSVTGKIGGGTKPGSMDIGAVAKYFAWPEGTDKAQYTSGRIPETVGAWEQMLKSVGLNGPYSDNQMGACCTCFVWGVLRYAGFDIGGLKQSLYTEFEGNSDWEKIGTDVPFSELKDGDVLVEMYDCGFFPCHYKIYVEGDDGEGHFAEASVTRHSYGLISSAVDKSSTVGSNVDVWRNKKNVSGSGGDECDICAGSDESGDGQLKEGGYDNVEDAKGIIEEYHKTWKNDSPHFGDVCNEGKFAGSPHANCTNFSMWFAYHYMGCTDLANKGKMGYEVADRIYEVCKGKFNKMTKSNTPTVYSVVSWNRPVGKMGSSNHTAVVIGINKAKDQIIFADAAWCNHDGRIWEDKLSKYMGNGTYVDISAYVTGVKK